ncbi:IPT/TIG domain-containing protein [Myxococcota bacterium]|nr:IPT/TIG domain-containing protein [Myxococcota bacterium]
MVSVRRRPAHLLRPAALLLAGLAACADVSEPDEALDATTSLYALVETIDGTSFLPPLGPEPVVTGAFDATLLGRLSVRLESEAAGRVRTEATFDANSAPALGLRAAKGVYMVNVPAAAYFTDRAREYRFRVSLDGREIGRSDLSSVVFSVLDKNPGLLVGVKLRVETRGAPVIATISPDRVIYSGRDVTLTVTGSGFVSDSVARLGGVALATNVVSGSLLTATLPAAELANAGARALTVATPAPGGGVSAEASIDLLNPTPVIAGLEPDSAVAGSAALTLTVHGADFIAGAQVWFGGTALSTTHVSSTVLTALVPASFLANVGSAAIVVTSPAPSEHASDPAPFAIVHPVPLATSISPSNIAGSEADFPITVSGAFFDASSFVSFAGAPLATRFVSSSELVAVVSASMVGATGYYPVVVTTPAPGGGTSGAIDFHVVLFSQTEPAASCEAARAAGGIADGVYWIDPDGVGGMAPFRAHCDQTTDGGGWMLVLHADAPVTSTAYDLRLRDVAVRGEPLKTATNDVVRRPVATNGLTNLYSDVLFKGGTTTWQDTMGEWVRVGMFPIGTTAPSTTYSNVRTALGGTSAWHQRRAWSDLTITIDDAFSLWDAGGISPICGGANRPGSKNCPHFNQNQAAYAYHYDTSSFRELYVRGPQPSPVPTVASLTPSSLVVGSPLATLTINGSSFVSGAVVIFDGVPLATTYVSASQLTAPLPAGTAAVVSTHTVAVTNPAPGGGTSGAVTLEVAALGSAGAPGTSCQDIYSSGTRADGRYFVSINGVSTLVYCDMTTNGGGWMLVLYAGGTVGTAYNATMRQVVVRGETLVSATSDAVNRPVPSGVTNTFTQVLYKGGTTTWRNTMGAWVTIGTIAPGSTTISTTYAGAATASGRTNVYSASRGWSGTTVSIDSVFSLWDAAGVSPICGGANVPGSKNCPYFNQNQAAYPYHYDTASTPRELYVR